jgi:NADH dehydrogenase
MNENELDVVTGAFNYTGRYITRRLLSMGRNVRTLTSQGGEGSLAEKVEAFPFTFDDPARLKESLKGASAFYNTYWVRFPRGETTYEKAVENTRVLIRAAKEAGVRRFVHISITNASQDSALPYFKGKGQIEEALIESGLSYAIIRPAVIFGKEDILINNIAWILRRFPVFGVMGSGAYRLRPIFVEDLARIAVDAGQKNENVTIDAVGPETFTFDELVRLIARKTGSRSGIIHVPPAMGYLFSKMIGLLVGDVVLTWDEVRGLTAGLLDTDSPPTGETRLSEWLEQNAQGVGKRYASELKRHYA